MCTNKYKWHLIMVLICISLTVLLNVFLCTYWPSLYLWGNVCPDSVTIFYSGGLSFLLLLSYISYLCILNINPLLNIWFANMFSRSVGCFSFWWWFPLLCRGFLVLCGPVCLFLLLLLLVLESGFYKKPSLRPICQRAYYQYFLFLFLFFFLEVTYV